MRPSQSMRAGDIHRKLRCSGDMLFSDAQSRPPSACERLVQPSGNVSPSPNSANNTAPGGCSRDGIDPHLSWKVRYRTLLWFLIKIIKLYKARSLLYRRQILQENIRWKALDEIYKIYMLLHRSDLNISEKNRQTFSHFLQKFAKFTHFRKMFIEFCSEFDEILCMKSKEILSEFRKYFRRCWKILNFF